jgi:hypothetical protein
VKYVLGLLALVLAAALVLQWYDWPPPENGSQPGAEPMQVGSSSEARPLSPTDFLDPPVEKADYLNVAERPLFLPDRRPPAEEPEEPEIPEAVPNVALDKFDLTAIIITPDESVAWVRSPSKATPEKVRLGDDIDGWTVKVIRDDEIELERQGESDTLVLRDYAKGPPPAVPTRNPRAAVRRPVRAPPNRTTTAGGGTVSSPPQSRQPRIRNNVQSPR